MSRHQHGKRNKLKGKAKFDTFWQQKVLAKEYVKDLLDNDILMSAFTVCPLGSIGPMGMGLLYGEHHPGRHKGARELKLNAKKAWEAATGPHAPSNLLGRADRAWAELNRTLAFFGRSYHSATPKAWTERFIGFNIAQKLASHLQRGIEQMVTGISRGAKRGYTPGQDTWSHRAARPSGGYRSDRLMSDRLLGVNASFRHDFDLGLTLRRDNHRTPWRGWRPTPVAIALVRNSKLPPLPWGTFCICARSGTRIGCGGMLKMLLQG